MVTENGIIKKTKLSAFKNIRSSGIIAIHLSSTDRLIWVKQTQGNHHLLLVSKTGKAIRFHEKDVRPSGRNTKGVKGISLKKANQVVGMVSFTEKPHQPQDRRKKFFRHLLVVTQHGLGKRTDIAEFPLQKRGGVGVKAAQVTSKTGNLVAALMVTHSTHQIVITSKKAQVIKLPIKNIKQLGRATQGVILMRFAKKDDTVAAVAALKKYDLEDSV